MYVIYYDGKPEKKTEIIKSILKFFSQEDFVNETAWLTYDGPWAQVPIRTINGIPMHFIPLEKLGELNDGSKFIIRGQAVIDPKVLETKDDKSIDEDTIRISSALSFILFDIIPGSTIMVDGEELHIQVPHLRNNESFLPPVDKYVDRMNFMRFYKTHMNRKTGTGLRKHSIAIETVIADWISNAIGIIENPGLVFLTDEDRLKYYQNYLYNTGTEDLMLYCKWYRDDESKLTTSSIMKWFVSSFYERIHCLDLDVGFQKIMSPTGFTVNISHEYYDDSKGIHGYGMNVIMGEELSEYMNSGTPLTEFPHLRIEIVEHSDRLMRPSNISATFDTGYDAIKWFVEETGIISKMINCKLIQKRWGYTDVHGSFNI